MTTVRPRFPTPVVVAAALALGLAACGGGGDTDTDASTDPGGTGIVRTSTAPTTTGATPPATSFRTLANAVCRAEVSDVPPVPDVPTSPTDATTRRYAAQTRRYVAAVERAAGGLADALVVLERRRPESQDALGPLVTKARAVVRSSGGSTSADGDQPGAGGIEDELRVTIALLNEATSAAGLPTCSL